MWSRNPIPVDTDPAPVLVDDCGQVTQCAASSIQERYRCVIRDCKAPYISLKSGIPDFVLAGRLNYYALVERVTRGCPDLPSDLCIPLANIRLPQGDYPPQPSDIDISVRPIVYSTPPDGIAVPAVRACATACRSI